jgi:hypothetical protein
MLIFLNMFLCTIPNRAFSKRDGKNKIRIHESKYFLKKFPIALDLWQMRTLNRTLIILLIITLLGLAGWGLYQLGRDKGESNIKSQIIENYTLIEKIAELASLEVSGTSEIKVSNAETES